MKRPYCLFVGLILPWALSACVSAPPEEEYNLAYAALQSAKRANAAQIVPGLWSRAESTYQSGELAFGKEDYSKARNAFNKALLYAEKAENAAVIRNAREGGVE